MMSISCSQCGAANPVQTGQCWLCHLPLSGQQTGTGGASAAATEAPAQTASTFTISSLMLIIALIALCLGVTREAPGLGIALGVVSTPALVRTVFAARRRESTGRPMSVGEKLGAFLGSIAVVVTLCAASGAAFVAICFPIGLASFNRSRGDSAGIVLAFSLGIVAGLVVIFFLARRLWPRKE